MEFGCGYNFPTVPGGGAGGVAEQSMTPSMTNGEASTILKGSIVYLSAANQMKLARADVVGTSKVLGAVTEDVPSGSAAPVVRSGTIAGVRKETGLAALTPTSRLFLSATDAGTVTHTAPAGPNIEVDLGDALNTTDLLLIPERPVQ